MQDRTNLTPELLEKMRGELIELLSKYVEMDKDALELNFEQEGNQMALMLSIPVLRAKDEDEIEETENNIDDADSEDDEELMEENTTETDTEENSSPEGIAENDEQKEEESNTKPKENKSK